MSPRASSSRKSSGPPAPADIYVGLLVVATCSLLTGIIFLWLELNAYEWRLP
jgi:hypothetical protein